MKNFTKREYEAKLPGDKEPESGASLVEYALLLALIAVVCLAAVQTLGQTVSNRLSSLASAVDET